MCAPKLFTSTPLPNPSELEYLLAGVLQCIAVHCSAWQCLRVHKYLFLRSSRRIPIVFFAKHTKRADTYSVSLSCALSRPPSLVLSLSIFPPPSLSHTLTLFLSHIHTHVQTHQGAMRKAVQ